MDYLHPTHFMTSEMIQILAYLFGAAYQLSLGMVSLYCLAQVYLLVCYLTSKRKTSLLQSNGNEPFVTIQLPLYNEKNVAERLIRCVMEMDWPKDKLQVQILDDSTDETAVITKALQSEYRTLGYDISCLQRTVRGGYKAGALKSAMDGVKGEFIAIFDADFLPERDFLRRILPFFHDQKVGIVQGRWAHLNQNATFLTELQAMQLDVHFTIEQGARSGSGFFSQFNGTAGVWRTTCISDAGGWEADTLTEDLDLSFRAQMKGWQCIYLEHLTVPAELPSDISALRSQQYRWMKGGAETARKLIPAIWKSNVSPGVRLQATVHLLASSVFLFVLALGLSSLPLAWIASYSPELFEKVTGGWTHLTVYVMPIWLVVYAYANIVRSNLSQPLWRRIMRFAVYMPLLLGVSMALALHHSGAVIEGWKRKKTAFVRTPKTGSLQSKLSDSKRIRLIFSSLRLVRWEIILTGVYLSTAVFALLTPPHPFLYFHLLAAVGHLVWILFHISYVSDEG
ncbi:MAG: glycosyltransferase [Saprospiraceae bacterium]|nr:glycosyltransferase [Saprospiraceae bacterium]